LDNSEHQIIELIEDKIKKWWHNTPSFVYNNKEYSANNFILTLFRSLSSQLNDTETQYQKYLKDLSGEMSKIQMNVDNLSYENQKLKKEIDLLKEKISQQGMRSNASTVVSIENNKKSFVSVPSDNTIEIFNNWAKEPKTRMPLQFAFADGELKLREKQNINETGNNNSLWIINKSGTMKYLFPNPNVIDEIGGNIDTIYTVTGTRKAKGQNRINVLKACEIKDDGWIEYKGELNLL
jgi:regulator of replication initiation timing